MNATPQVAQSNAIAAKAVSDTGDVDTTTAGIAFRRRTAHFARRFDAPDIDENVDGGIDRKRDDIGHVRHPAANSGPCLRTGPVTELNRYFLVAVPCRRFQKIVRNSAGRPAFQLFVTMTAEAGHA